MFRNHPGVKNLPFLTRAGILGSNVGVLWVYFCSQVRPRDRTRGVFLKSGIILSCTLFYPYTMVFFIVSLFRTFFTYFTTNFGVRYKT